VPFSSVEDANLGAGTGARRHDDLGVTVAIDVARGNIHAAAIPLAEGDEIVELHWTPMLDVVTVVDAHARATAVARAVTTSLKPSPFTSPLATRTPP
jgi:hypothetical protein